MALDFVGVTATVLDEELDMLNQAIWTNDLPDTSICIVEQLLHVLGELIVVFKHRAM
jgi:hypothetical protein